ncbi:hypothetical protein HJD18_16380 [Thermoleophilia bacterium SCSIO 60948]|nr:hypothetical protein HJD18_16380 [Thermoleophilia bacterium SCSIO 60948]
MRRLLLAALLASALGVCLWFAPDAAAQSGDDVGQNLGDLLKGYAGQIYGGVVAIISLVFLLNRRYTELGLFFIAAVLVAWLVFSPDQVAETARGIGDQVLP